MVYKKCAILISFCFIGQAVGCTLDRNEFNEYPFMVKIADVGGQVFSIGLLVGPDFFISAYDPVQKLVDAHTYDPPHALSNLTVVAQLLGRDAAKLCSESRTPSLVRKAWKGRTDRNVAFWRLINKFNVTSANPFLFPRLNDLTKHAMEINFNNTRDNECCFLPVFKSKSLGDGTIIKHKVTFVVGNLADYWTREYCSGSSNVPVCITVNKRDYFFVYSPEDLSPLWYQGAAVICNGNALGILSKVIKDRFSERIIMIEKLLFSVSLLRAYAVNEWPTPPPKKS